MYQSASDIFSFKFLLNTNNWGRVSKNEMHDLKLGVKKNYHLITKFTNPRNFNTINIDLTRPQIFNFLINLFIEK